MAYNAALECAMPTLHRVVCMWKIINNTVVDISGGWREKCCSTITSSDQSTDVNVFKVIQDWGQMFLTPISPGFLNRARVTLSTLWLSTFSESTFWLFDIMTSTLWLSTFWLSTLWPATPVPARAKFSLMAMNTWICMAPSLAENQLNAKEKNEQDCQALLNAKYCLGIYIAIARGYHVRVSCTQNTYAKSSCNVDLWTMTLIFSGMTEAVMLMQIFTKLSAAVVISCWQTCYQ